MVVLAIIVIMSALAIPAASSLANSGSFNRAVDGISLLVTQARTYAMSRNTYVWVGFAPDTTSQELTVGAVAGSTGSVSDLGSNQTYFPITKAQTYGHLAFKVVSSLGNSSTSEDDIAESAVGTFQQTSGGSLITFSKVFQFDPQGEATMNILPPDGTHWIQIGLQPMRGTYISDPNIAVFQIETLTGQIETFRP